MRLTKQDEEIMKKDVLPFRLVWKDIEMAVEADQLNWLEIIMHSPSWVFSKIAYHVNAVLSRGNKK